MAARDPGIALACGACFVARGNLAIVGTFFTLWLANYGTVELGMSRAEAIAKVGCIITSSVLIAQQSPLKMRGSIIGCFNLTGAIGIMVASKVGGTLFDSRREAAPFMLFGLAALLVLVWSLLLRKKVQPLA